MADGVGGSSRFLEAAAPWRRNNLLEIETPQPRMPLIVATVLGPVNFHEIENWQRVHPASEPERPAGGELFYGS
jgi:hypothetical protein